MQSDQQWNSSMGPLHHAITTGRCAVAAVVVIADARSPIGPAVVTVSDDSLLTVTATPLRTTTTGAARLPAAEVERIAEILRLARATELDPPLLQTDATAAGARLGPTSP
jgi:hypothetical protein